MLIKSTRFGDVEVADEVVLQFPHGLPGFSEERVFAFLPYQPDSPFAFLQSTTTPDLTFMVVEAFAFFKDYNFEIDTTTSEELGISDENVPQIFNVVRVPEKLEEMTANLSAPLIVNWRDQKAAQIVLENSSYTIRHRLFPDGLPRNVEQGGK